ncbi:MAG: DUF4381 domain-containing protein [Thiothrix sp.]|nr:MAG: DUF4381 domain-containing protein [Thiothrix sp.]
MNPNDLALRDIHLPAEIGWWPLAWGWWLVAALLLLGLVVLVAWFLKRSTHPKRINLSAQSSALQELTRIEQQYKHDPLGLVRELSVLLRRIAISLYGRRSVAGLTGLNWLQFLDQQGGSPVFSQRFQQALTELPYRAQGSTDVSALVQEVRQWLNSQASAGKQHV